MANPAQWAQWHDLGMRVSAEPGTMADLKAAPCLMVDTAQFDAGFRAELLKATPDLDASVDGLLVHGENFQTLTMLGQKFKHAVDFLYIDPPYNAATSEIAYKNGFKHSSWISLMENRLSVAKVITKSNAPICIAIDENEREYLALTMKALLGEGEHTQVSVVHNPRGIQGAGFSVTNESAIFFRPTGKVLGKKSLDDSKSKPLMKTGSESERHTAKNCFYPIFVKNGNVIGFGSVPEDNFHPDGACTKESDGTIAVWPISSTDGLERKWRYARQSVDAIIENLEVKNARNGMLSINLAKDTEAYRTVWADAEFNAAEYGSTLLKNILPNNGFSFPKSLHTVRHSVLAAACPSKGLVADFFAGSGTTAHAVLTINRDEGTSLRYVMVEQGEYFDTILKPRIQKVVFSAAWQDGKPNGVETGISHAFKVLKIEGYEDTLNNLDLKRSGAQANLLHEFSEAARDDYLMRYMLDIEAKGSLLSVADFRKPFDYTLKVAIDSAGAWEERKVDLVETFNYLIGLNVKEYDSDIPHGYVRVTGTLPDGKFALIIWRDCDIIRDRKSVV